MKPSLADSLLVWMVVFGLVAVLGLCLYFGGRLGR